MGDAAGPTLEAGTGLPVSPPIFIPAAVLDSPPAKRPWLLAAIALLVVCGVLTLLSLWKTFNLGGSAWEWRAWPYRPLLTAAARPLLVLPFVVIAMLFRRVPARAKAAILAVAILGTTISLVPGFREFHARQHIQPALLSAASALQVPVGLVPVNRPVPGLDSRDNPTPELVASAPDATWFWKPTSPSAGVCASLKAGYALRDGWEFDPALCEAMHASGRVVVALRAYDSKDLPAHPDAVNGTLAVPGVVVIVAPNDGADY
jgi:hypothetical protein